MLRRKFNLLKILTVGLICALASIFLFTGCSAKSSKKPEAPDAAEYGLYTNLTLSLDSGDGRVWATVKNTFTFLPSAVKVTVELYKSEAYKSSYKEMELAGENAVNDLDMGKSVTAEAETHGKQMYWQARAYYKIDKSGWQEQTTKIWIIKGNGNVVTTNALPPKAEEEVTPPSKDDPEIELPAEPFRLTDVIDGEPIKLEYRYNYYEYNYCENLNKGSGGYLGVPMQKCIVLDFKDERMKKCFEIINNIKLCNSNRPAVFIGDEVDEIFDNFTIRFNNAVRISVSIKNNGQIYCTYAENSSGYYDIGENHKTFVSEEGAVDINLISKLIESIIISDEEELLVEPFRLTDIIDGEPIKLEYRFEYIEPPKSGDIYSTVLPRLIELDFNDESKNQCYEYFKNIELLNSSEPTILIGEEVKEVAVWGISFYFENDIRLNIMIKNNGQVYISYVENSPGYYDIGENRKYFITAEEAVNINVIKKFIEELKEIN